MAPSSTSCSSGPGSRLPSPRAAVAAVAAESAAAAAAPAAAVVAMQLAPAAVVGVTAVVVVALVVPVLLLRAQPSPRRPRQLHHDRSPPPTRMTRMLLRLSLLPSPPGRRPCDAHHNVPLATLATGPTGRTRPRLNAACVLVFASSASATAPVLLATPTLSASTHCPLPSRSEVEIPRAVCYRH